MNKILEFIRKHSKITVILIILCSLLPLIIVHILFKWNSGIAFLVAEWSAGELLGYIGKVWRGLYPDAGKYPRTN